MDQTADDIVTPSTAARTCGVAAKTVIKAAKTGTLQEYPGGCVRLGDAVRWYAARGHEAAKGAAIRLGLADGGDTGAAGAAGGGSGDDLVASKARKAAADAELAEIKVAQAKGQLIDVGTAQRAWTAALAMVRAQVLAVAPRCAPAVAGMTAREALVELDRELRAALSVAADRMPQTMAEAMGAATGDDDGDDVG